MDRTGPVFEQESERATENTTDRSSLRAGRPMSANTTVKPNAGTKRSLGDLIKGMLSIVTNAIEGDHEIHKYR
jgi:hypothetical protein